MPERRSAVPEPQHRSDARQDPAQQRRRTPMDWSSGGAARPDMSSQSWPSGCSSSRVLVLQAGRCERPVPAIASSSVSRTDGVPMTSPSAAAVSSSGPSWTYVAFGDSWPYGATATAARHFPSSMPRSCRHDWAPHRFRQSRDERRHGTGSSRRFQGVPGDPRQPRARRHRRDRDRWECPRRGVRASVAGTCGGADKLDCFRTITEILRASFNGMLTEIERLRNGQPTVVRLVTMSNEFLADPDLIGALGADFGRTKASW